MIWEKTQNETKVGSARSRAGTHLSTLLCKYNIFYLSVLNKVLHHVSHLLWVLGLFYRLRDVHLV